MNEKKAKSKAPIDERARRKPGTILQEQTTTTIVKTVAAEKKVWFVPSGNLLELFRHEIMEKTGCSINDDDVSIYIRTDIDWRNEEFEGFTIEVIKATEK